MTGRSIFSCRAFSHEWVDTSVSRQSLRRHRHVAHLDHPGRLSLTLIPIDILPVFKSPAVQTLTFYGGMSAKSIANDISNRMERWTGQANGTSRQESRSIIGASIVRNYFQGDVDPNGALTQVNSLVARGDSQPAPGHAAAGRASL